MSFNVLIHNFINANTSSPEKDVITQNFSEKTAIALKKDPNLKMLSKYIRGGISKMTKANIINLTNSIMSYKKDVYMINNNNVVPDEEQDLIIKAPVNQNIRVVAGAGTGKTTTITCRIKYLLDTTTPDKILVLTFNVESRKNLEIMIDQLMGFEVKIEIRTIDSFCLKIKNDFNIKNYTNSSLSEFSSVGRQIMKKYGAEISAQYKYVFFDEFQDIDEDQFEILRSFSQNGCFLTVIGDDSQNIYQFRGSDNYYIINFDCLIQNTVTYKITTNYRSTQDIVNLANDSIVNNKDKIFKLMKHHININEKGIIDLTILNTKDESTDHIIQMIKFYVNNSHHKYGDIAILSRNTFLLKPLETLLEKSKLPYVALISDQYSIEYKQTIQQDKIVLSTIHRAKGLEWRTVFMVGLADSYFPSHLNNGLKNIEEERRLFYVGSTRAKHNLHYVTDIENIPLSRFIKEITHRLGEIINKSNRHIDNDIMFSVNNMDKVKDSYNVAKIVEMLNSKKIKNLRDMSLILDADIKSDIIFNDPILFTDNIKKNVFESDYGIFCDYYLTRKLMINNKQPIKDINVEKILLDIHLTDDERIIYTKYNIKECIIKNKEPSIDPKNINDIKIARCLIENIKSIIKTSDLSPHDIEYLLSMGIYDYQYPLKFIKNLRSAYNLFKNPSLSEKNMDPIYFVSLCPKLNNGRRRLVYRNINDLYKENSVQVIPRINEYYKKITKNVILCKLRMNKLYEIDKKSISFTGELNYIDITNNMIVELKYSESEFKIEWLIQLLLFYALYMCNPGCCENYHEIDISKGAIVNIFTGKYYEIDIPNDYDWEKLLVFVKDMISNDIKGIRDVKHNDVSLDVELFFSTKNTVTTQKHVKAFVIEVDLNKKRSGYIVIDVENNTTNMDIIQLSYIVYDNNNTELKRVNSYIKDRYVDNRTFQITGITTDDLRKKGENFCNVIKTFIEDLSTVKISNIEKFNIEIYEHNKINIKQIDPFTNISISDTNVLYKTYIKLTNTNGETTGTKLQNMYKDLFGLEMVGAHDALSDVIHTAKCFVILKNKLTKLGAEISEKPFDTLCEVNRPVKLKKLSNKLFGSTKNENNTLCPIDVLETKVVKKIRPIGNMSEKTELNSKNKTDRNTTLKNKSKTNRYILEDGLSILMDGSFFNK